MKKKKILFLILCTVLALMLCACAAEQPAEPVSAVKPAEPQIIYSHSVGYLASDMDNERCAAVEHAFEYYLPDDYEIKLVDAFSNASSQLTQADTMIAQDIEVLVVSPCDAETGKQIVVKAYEAGVPVVITGVVYSEEDIPVEIPESEIPHGDNAEYSAETESEHEEGAEESEEESESGDAETTDENAPVYQYIMPDAQVAFSGSEIANRAFTFIADTVVPAEGEDVSPAEIFYCHIGTDKQAFVPFRKGADIALEKHSSKITATGFATGLTDSQSVSEKITEMLANEFSHFNVVFVDDDTCAGGAVQALEGVSPEVSVVSAGGSDIGRELLESGKILADVIAPACFEGRQLSEFVKDIITGTEITEQTMLLPSILITHDNINEWIGWSDFEAEIPKID